MMNQSSVMSICLVGFLGAVGCIGISLMDSTSIKNTPVQIEDSQVESASSNPCLISEGQKISGTGTQELKDKVFYYSDYQNSSIDTFQKACEYAKESSDDYYLEYVEDSPGNRTGINFKKATVESDFQNGVVLGE